MPPQFQRFSGGRSSHQKGQGSGRRPGQRSFKGKRSREPGQNKRQDISETPQAKNDEPIPGSPAPEEDPSLQAKVGGIKTLHKQWKAEDAEDSVLLQADELMARQRQRCKQVGSVIFGFTLQEAQVDAVWTLFYEQRDLLLLAKTGFGKSLIFQLLPFMFEPTGIVIILMPLKLLQAEQNTMINRIPNGKAIALTGENNQKAVQKSIACENYTHVFTSPEIALSKKFKANVLDDPRFASRLSLLAIDEIHLVEEWGKSFRPLYAEIEKVRKRIPPQVPLLGVSATLTKSARIRIFTKAGFRDDYKLMQTSLDRPEIQQIHRFMAHPKSSHLDLQFVLPEKAMQASDIQKTIIFVNTVSEIRPIIEIIQAWMTSLGYPAGSNRWIRPYHSAMSDWDKELTAKAFKISGAENTECIILVATDAYGMGINNPDIRLVIQWDLPISFDSMIQRMGRAGRKGQQAWFVLLTPKWTKVTGPDEITKILDKRKAATVLSKTQPSTSTQLSSTRPSPLAQEIDLDNSDNDSVQSSDNDELGDEFHDPSADQLLDLLSTEAETSSLSKKMKKQASKTDAQKRANLPEEIFDYMHVAKCRRLFSLAWYDDLTYGNRPSSKPLPTLCCNASGCLSEDPDFLKREPFVKPVTVKYSEAEREWIACRFAALTEWRKEKSEAVWSKDGLDGMPESLLMSDQCLSSLSKEGEQLDDEAKLQDFLQPWPDLIEYIDEIFACICRSSSHGDSSMTPSKAQRREVLKAARASKKIKFMDNPTIAEAARIITMRDQWLISNNKTNSDLKVRLKKAKEAERKQKAKLDKNRQKAQEQAQINDIRRLAIGNRQLNRQLIGMHKDILSDPPAIPSSDPPNVAPPPELAPSPATINSIGSMLAVRKQQQSKKRAHASKQSNKLRRPMTQANRVDSVESDGSVASTASRKRRKSPTPPPLQMELIRPGKRKVKVTAAAVESISSKRMRVAEAQS